MEPTTHAGDHPFGQLQSIKEAPALRHRIHEQVEQLIISKTLAPGSRLKEVELAATLGVSRGPVREALQQLAADGYVDLRPRKGAFVHIPTADELENFFVVRRILEGQSARLAAENINEDGASRLSDCLEAAKSILDRGEDPLAVYSGIDFHGLVVDLSGNDVLAKMLKDLRKKSLWLAAPFSHEHRRKSWAEHTDVADAIIEQDPARAVEAMNVHIDNAWAHTVDSIEREPASIRRH